MNILNRFSLLFFLLLSSSIFSQDRQLQDFSQTIGGTDMVIEMVAIPSGKFTMGSPESEENRQPDEGPTHLVQMDSFWISKYEITWDLYNLFVQRAIDDIETNSSPRELNLDVDAISGATIPYVDMSLGMGTSSGMPVGNITQFAASQFCKWLSAKTGHFYRLPTEAEWEYAARAGTTTAYHFGNDPKELDKYAWSYENSKDTYHTVGEKAPNPWGLYDMYGNVAEWTLDLYDADIYQTRKDVSVSPLNLSTKTSSHTVRGGSYRDQAKDHRSASRLKSTEKWKMRDPQFPKSKWWNTDSPFVGFRIVRDPNVPNETELKKYWGE